MMNRKPPFEQPVLKFDNRVALVTGAAGNLGSAMCRMLAEQGVRVAAADLSAELVAKRLQPSVDAGLDIRPYGFDITKRDEVRASVDRILADFGHIDILVNNAGAWIRRNESEFQRFERVPVEEWQRLIDININGTLHCLQAVLPHMLSREYGRIVNLGSITGEVGSPGRADYSLCKAGIIMLTKTLAMENAKRGITVNCVSPGWINPPAVGVGPCDGTWIGWSGDATDVARAVVFLASDSAWYMTGVDLPVDGGRILGPHNCDM